MGITKKCLFYVELILELGVQNNRISIVEVS